MNIFTTAVLVLIWLYILRIMRKANLNAWHFVWGSMGLFLILMLAVQPFLTQHLIRSVSALSGLVGSLTKTFSAYFKYGIIYVPASIGSITLQVDFECSGIIEIMAFLSLLTFFNVYSKAERLMVAIAGSALIIIFNAIRIIIICFAVHFFGVGAYYVTHMFIGRLFFYACSVLLYFYVFTKPQIIQTKIGSFAYANNKEDS